MLPEELDADTLRWIALAALILLGAGLFVTLRIIRRMWLRVLVMGAIVSVGLAVWLEREDLRQCTTQCSCEFFGRDVAVPACDPIPDP